MHLEFYTNKFPCKHHELWYTLYKTSYLSVFSEYSKIIEAFIFRNENYYIYRHVKIKRRSHFYCKPISYPAVYIRKYRARRDGELPKKPMLFAKLHVDSRAVIFLSLHCSFQHYTCITCILTIRFNPSMFSSSVIFCKALVRRRETTRIDRFISSVVL